MDYKAFFAANSIAIGKKNNAVDRPSPCCHSPQGVVQGTLSRPVPHYQLLRPQAIKEDNALPPAATFWAGSPKLSSPPEWVPIT
jgi:hypothetical protein